MDQETLVDEQIKAGAQFVQNLAQEVPLKAAFWVKPDEVERWRLWIASDRLGDDNLNQNYQTVSRVARAMHHPWLCADDVKLANADDRLVKAVLQAQHEYPGRWPMRFPGRSLKGATAEQLYVYEVPQPFPG